MRIHAIVAGVLLLGGCASIGRHDLDRAQAYAVAARSTAIDCSRADACATPSPLRALGDRALGASTPGSERDYVQVIERGEDALLARINLIRSARRSIDLQTYIFGQDDSGYLVLNELLAAARRGVKVRLLVDQVNAPGDLDLLADLASEHVNFEMRLYNPIFDRARTSTAGYVLGILCCFHRINQRMHNKLLLVDDRVGITGGRNIADDYFDWDPLMDFRDRDVLLAGPATRNMQRVFELFWNNRRTLPLARLKDVARVLVAHAGPPKLAEPLDHEHRTARVLAMSAVADDQDVVAERLVDTAVAVAHVEYIADGPGKHEQQAGDGGSPVTGDLREIIEGAHSSVVMQTPYLVLSDGAREMFKRMHERPDPPVVTISTNSLASTDAFPVYALSYKYKRRYLRELGFNLYETKPQPLDSPVDVAATNTPERTSAQGREGTNADAVDNQDGKAGGDLPAAGQRGIEGALIGSGGSAGNRRFGGSTLRTRTPSDEGVGIFRHRNNRLVPLRETGLRISMHAKSIVVDDAIGIIGSHNFDPRSDHYNTEGVVVVHDPEIAQRIRQAILLDAAPQNSWLIARRPPSAVSGINATIARAFEELPLFDFWPFRYATSYELKPGCAPLPVGDPHFHDCWTSVGDFPGSEISFKTFATRVLTAFGSGFAPIL
jgi:phosphatidylserine/phosphatidylglycerophosphate/cardiolipin synthase-like enzyme